MAERADGRTAVVVATKDRRDSLLATLARLTALPEQPLVVVADNGSTDGTAAAARSACPHVRVMELGVNLGAAARTLAAENVDHDYVAFADDDSWWAPGALRRAADLFDAHRRLGLIAGRVLVGPERRLDPVCAEMADSPLPPYDELPFRPVLGFIACGALVRREPFLAQGGFHQRFGVGGEEELLALDLRAAHWQLAYVDDVVAYHHPSPSRDPVGRRQIQMRNDLWTTWLRRPWRAAAKRTFRAATAAMRDPGCRGGVIEALRGARWVARERHVLPHDVERCVRLLETSTTCPA